MTVVLLVEVVPTLSALCSSLGPTASVLCRLSARLSSSTARSKARGGQAATITPNMLRSAAEPTLARERDAEDEGKPCRPAASGSVAVHRLPELDGGDHEEAIDDEWPDGGGGAVCAELQREVSSVAVGGVSGAEGDQGCTAALHRQSRVTQCAGCCSARGGHSGHRALRRRRSITVVAEIRSSREEGVHVDAVCAPGEIRTHTGRVLNPLPLPVGLRGRCAVNFTGSRERAVRRARECDDRLTW